VVWQEITGRRRPGTVCAAFVVFSITPLNQPITIDKSAGAAVVAAARKELAYFEQFGQPLLPFRRERRDGYKYQEQSPSTHIENLKRYLLIASSLVPRDTALGRLCICHPDLQQSNYRRSEVVRLWLASRQPARLATCPHPAPVSPCQRTPTPPEPR
jgi:hypothetical protein